MLNTFYRKFCHLRLAQNIVHDVNSINMALYNFHGRTAINLISTLALKYENELNKIAFYLSGRPVIKGEMSILYGEHSLDNIEEDLYYLKDCLIIIGAVRFGVVKDIEEALKLVIPQELENEENFDYSKELVYID